MLEKNYNILPKVNGEVINFITNSASKIYKDNILISDLPLGDFSRYVDTIYMGFYIEEHFCKFIDVTYFIEDDYEVVTSNLGDCVNFDSSNKTKLVITPKYSYNTLTLLLEVNDSNNYLFFIWRDKWDILYKEEVVTPTQIWSGNLPAGYYVLYIDTNTPPSTTIKYGSGQGDTYTESLVVFYAEGATTITLEAGGIQTIYLRSFGVGEMLVKTTSSGLYIYSKETVLGPFIFPINTPCIFDFEYFGTSGGTELYIYCNHFLIGSGTLIHFEIIKDIPIYFNFTSVDIVATILSAKVYSLGLFTSTKPSPAVVYDICLRSISSPVSKNIIYDNDNLYVYKTDYSVWVLDYYNNSVMVLYGDHLKKSTITSLYNNLAYSHNNYNTVSYGFSLSQYRIVDVLYKDGIFILLLEDRIVILDKFGTFIRHINCKNISSLFYVNNYILFYDKTRARLYRVYSNNFRDFELPSILMNVSFDTKFKICHVPLSPFSVVNGDYVSVVKEQSIFGYSPLYDYFDIRNYELGGYDFNNLVFEYDLVQNATKFTGIATTLSYKVFANNPIESGLDTFTVFVRMKPMSLKFKRYILRILSVLDIFLLDGVLTVELKCKNSNNVVTCTHIFNINAWYNVHVTYHSSTGLYIYVDGVSAGSKEFDYNTGGTKEGKYVIIGGYGTDAYAAYKFKGFIKNFFISRSFINSVMAKSLKDNNVYTAEVFSEYNTYIDMYGVTGVLQQGNSIFVSTYDGLYVYDSVTFQLIKSFGEGNLVLDININNNILFANLIKLPPTGTLTGSINEVVKISGELYGKIFMAGNNACPACIYNGNTYVKFLASSVSVLDASDYFGTDTIHGFYTLGKFHVDPLTTEIQLIAEFGYDEECDEVIGDDSAFSMHSNKALDCCDISWGGASACVDSYTSAIIYPNQEDKINYDAFIDITYRDEYETTINLFGISIGIAQDGDLYTFIISRLEDIKFPYEPVLIDTVESLSGLLNISPYLLYHSENTLIGCSRVKFYFEASPDNLKVLKEKKVKVLESDVSSIYRFAYDFRGGKGNGVKHVIENDVSFGSFDGTAYFINNNFMDTPIWDISAEFILRIDSYKEFNPIFSKSTGVKLSYGLALFNDSLKFLFGQEDVISILDLGVTIKLNQLTFVAIFVTDVYIDIFVNGTYNRVPFYGNPDIVEGALHVGFGISLKSRVSRFVGDMFYFDIDHAGSLSKINSDYATYVTSVGTTYDEIINLDEYYHIDDNIFKMCSGWRGTSRFFRLHKFYMIGSDTTKEVSSVTANSIFSNSLLRQSLSVDITTLDYTLGTFVGCKDFAYDNVGGLYTVTTDNKIEYKLENICDIDKLKHITTIKYSDTFTLFGTLGGLIKVNNILSNNVTKQYWPINNGVTGVLIGDEYVYIACGKELGFVQVKYLEDTLDEVITRSLIPVYTSEAIIKSIIKYENKTYILSDQKIINATDGEDIYVCGDANSLFKYKNDILIIYDNYIKRYSDKKVLLEIKGKITDVTCGDTLVVSTSSGFYIFNDNLDSFILNIVSIVGVLKDFTCLVSDYCYHVYLNNNNVIYIYRDFTGIKLVEFNIENKTSTETVILSDLIDGSFSDFVPHTFNSIGK